MLYIIRFVPWLVVFAAAITISGPAHAGSLDLIAAGPLAELRDRLEALESGGITRRTEFFKIDTTVDGDVVTIIGSGVL